MTTTHLGSVRPKTGRALAPRRIRRPILLQRAALAVSVALADWAEDSAPKERSAAVSRERARRRSIQLRDAELRREAAITQQLLLPRQF